MQKPLFLSLAISVALTGCSTSPTWSRVRSVRVDVRDTADPSGVYAEQLSSVLRTAGVEHRVVTYQFRYHTRLREEAVGTRTAVIYRDDSNPANPWWLMDDRAKNPVWVPGSD